MEYEECLRQEAVKAEVLQLRESALYQKLVRNGVLQPIQDESRQKVCV